MAVLIVKVPPDVARTLWSIPIEEDVGVDKGLPFRYKDEWEEKAHAHVTMIYFPKDDWQTLGKAMGVIFKECQSTRPFPLYTSEVNKFEPTKHSKGRAPIICKVVSNELRDIQKRIWEGLEAADVEFAKNFVDYKPHVTLGYAPHDDPEDPAVEWKGLDIPTVSWGCHELTLWCGENGDDRMSVTFPLSLGMNKAARVSTRHRMAEVLWLVQLFRLHSPNPPNAETLRGLL